MEDAVAYDNKKDLFFCEDHDAIDHYKEEGIPLEPWMIERRIYMDDYFDTSISYPNVTDIAMQPGVLLEYVSSTFLEGWINYVQIINAYVIFRYSNPGKTRQRVERFNLIDGIIHTKLGQFGDDVLILAKGSERDGPLYWFFWFDRDSSDCMIGRFSTDEDESTVVASFCSYVVEVGRALSNEYIGAQLDPIALNTDHIHGWLSF
jgi:hypothetical protein